MLKLACPPSRWDRERQAESDQDETAALHNADLYYTHVHTLHVPVLPCGRRPFNDRAVDDRLTRASESKATEPLNRREYSTGLY